MSTKPVFKNILQVGIIVRDAESAARKYWDTWGIGPWRFYSYNKSNMRDTKVRGKDVEFTMRAALTTIGNVELELIQPLDDKSIYAEFLREHGEGVHHIAMAVDDYDETRALAKSNGSDALQEGKVSTAEYAYLDTEKTMLFITEIYKWPDDVVMPHLDKTYPSG